MKTHQFDISELKEEKEILARLRHSKTWIDPALLTDKEYDEWDRSPIIGKTTVIM